MYRGTRPFLIILFVITSFGCFLSRKSLDKWNPPYCPPEDPNCGCTSKYDDCHAPTDPHDPLLFGPGAHAPSASASASSSSKP